MVSPRPFIELVRLEFWVSVHRRGRPKCTHVAQSRREVYPTSQTLLSLNSHRISNTVFAQSTLYRVDHLFRPFLAHVAMREISHEATKSAKARQASTARAMGPPPLLIARLSPNACRAALLPGTSRSSLALLPHLPQGSRGGCHSLPARSLATLWRSDLTKTFRLRPCPSRKLPCRMLHRA